MKFLFILLLSLACPLSYATDTPTAAESADTSPREECIANSVDNCIQTVCSNSEEPGCTDKCKSTAADKCDHSVSE